MEKIQEQHLSLFGFLMLIGTMLTVLGSSKLQIVGVFILMFGILHPVLKPLFTFLLSKLRSFANSSPGGIIWDSRISGIWHKPRRTLPPRNQDEELKPSFLKRDLREQKSVQAERRHVPDLPDRSVVTKTTLGNHRDEYSSEQERIPSL